MAERIECGQCGKDCAKTKSGAPRAHKCEPRPAGEPTPEQREEMALRRAGGAGLELANLTGSGILDALSRADIAAQVQTDTSAANWNNTGRPRPSASNVAMPTLPTVPQDPQRVPLLDRLAEQQRAMATAAAPAVPGPPAAPVEFADPADPAQSADPLAFADPTPVSDPEPEPLPKTNRNGYLLKDPVLGTFRRFKNGNIRGITRVTTFNKAASDQTAIKDWSKRNVLIGASRRPDLVAQVHGRDVSADKDFLNGLVESLEEAANAKVSADIGTLVHTYTEEIDSGRITLDDVPPAYRGHVASYVQALDGAGLRVIPDLMERTTFVEEFGGVAGSFDRVLHHVASDTYVMGDLKTGKSMTYGWDEIECQEALYTAGYNRFGTYVWPTGQDPESGHWEPPKVQLRTDVGVVMWLPVQGETAGQCQLLMTDLQRGWRHAALCHAVREGRSSKGKPVAWTAPERDWMTDFQNVTSVGHAGRLWELARAAGVAPNMLGALVAQAQNVLRSRGLTG